MTAIIVQGDARALQLPDESVDLIVTSPPYFALRSYTDGGEHYAGQIGSEATPQEFIAALVECTREWMRVLKPSGSMFVNLGDKYGRNGGVDRKARGSTAGDPGGRAAPRLRQRVAGNDKSLMLLPERYRIACVDDLGLIARAVIVWSKPNGLPESVTDRVRRSHEDWVHLTKLPRYFAAVDEIREPTNIGARPVQSWAERKAAGNITHAPDNGHSTGVGMAPNPLGKLPGSVWEVASQPLTVPKELGIDHFAAFPTEWPRRIILGWSPSGICVECGEGRRPRLDVDREHVDYSLAERRATERVDATQGAITGGTKRSTLGHQTTRTITGYACKCAEPTAATRPAVVLDPFGGTGTTALVASVLGRVGISVDLSGDYCRLARWRTTDAKQLERAQRPARPRKQPSPPEPQPQWSQDEWLAHFAAQVTAS